MDSFKFESRSSSCAIGAKSCFSPIPSSQIGEGIRGVSDLFSPESKVELSESVSSSEVERLSEKKKRENNTRFHLWNFKNISSISHETERDWRGGGEK